MPGIKTLLLTGGIIHDWQGCGDEIERILRTSAEFEVTRVNDDLSVLEQPNLSQYDIALFYWTRGELSDAQRDRLMTWLASGKGFVGIHSAASSFWESREFHQMLGGMFKTHPAPRDYEVRIVDREHAITEGMSDFQVHDEQYIMELDPGLHVLASAEYEGTDVPAAWTKSWGEGRVYFLALGHDAESCQNPNFAELLVRGSIWAAGK